MEKENLIERLEKLIGTEECYEVEFKSIDLNVIKQLKIGQCGKYVRRMIIDAYEEAKKHQYKYNNKFNIVIPNNDLYRERTYTEIQGTLSESGAHIVDWVELGLYWAQMITNDKKEFIKYCNEVDLSKYRRVFIYYDGNPRYLGGSEKFKHKPIYVEPEWRSWDEKISFDCVPLIVKYNKN